MKYKYIFTVLCLVFGFSLAAQTEHVWTKSYGGNGWDYGGAIALDEAGNIYVSGRFSGAVDFDPGNGFNFLDAAGSTDVYIQKLNPEGEFIWARAVGGAGEDVSFGLDLDGEGNVYVTGNFSGTADFDPGDGVFNLATTGLSDVDAFILKLDTDGNFEWAGRISSPGTEYGYGVAVDDDGNSYLTGYFSQTADLDPGPGVTLATVGGTGVDNDFYVVKLDPDGNLDWGYGIGGVGQDRAYAVHLDDFNNVLVCGHFGRTVDFDPTSAADLISTGTTSVALNGFMVKLRTDGQYVGAVSFGSASEYEYARSVKTDASGNIYCTGYFRGTMDVDPGPGVTEVTANGGRDMFLAKYTPDLELIWGLNAGGVGNEYGRSLAIDPADGTAYVAASQYTSELANWGDDECPNEVQGIPGTSEILVLASYDAEGNHRCVLELDTRQSGFYSAGYQTQMVIRDGELFYAANYSSNQTDFDPGEGIVAPPFSGGAWDVAISKYILIPFEVDLGDEFGICKEATVTLDVTADNATYVWQDGSTEPTFLVDEAGTYSVLVNSSGCIAKDEVMAVEDQINNGIISNEGLLLAELNGGQYQWVTCPDLTPIEGETGQTYNPEVTGEYAVIVFSNECVDTSACLEAIVSSVDEFGWNDFEVYPNPVGPGNEVQVRCDRAYRRVEASIYSLDGKLLQTVRTQGVDLLSIPFRAPAGVYILALNADGKLGRRKIVRQ